MHDSITNVSPRIQSLKASLQAESLASAASLVRELLTVGNVQIPASQVRAADKVAALDKVAKILGLYKEQDAGARAPAVITQVVVVLSGGEQAGSNRQVLDVSPVRLEPEGLERPGVAPGMDEGLEAPRIEP